jgi:hypothetical protein
VLEGLSLLGIDTAQLSLSALFKASSSASLFIFLARSISLSLYLSISRSLALSLPRSLALPSSLSIATEFPSLAHKDRLSPPGGQAFDKGVTDRIEFDEFEQMVMGVLGGLAPHEADPPPPPLPTVAPTRVPTVHSLPLPPSPQEADDDSDAGADEVRVEVGAGAGRSGSARPGSVTRGARTRTLDVVIQASQEGTVGRGAQVRRGTGGRPPPLPYKVDTSRPSLRTNWTRLVGVAWEVRGLERRMRDGE